jgi:hypothetical protein
MKQIVLVVEGSSFCVAKVFESNAFLGIFFPLLLLNCVCFAIAEIQCAFYWTIRLMMDPIHKCGEQNWTHDGSDSINVGSEIGRDLSIGNWVGGSVGFSFRHCAPKNPHLSNACSEIVQ